MTIVSTGSTSQVIVSSDEKTVAITSGGSIIIDVDAPTIISAIDGYFVSNQGTLLGDIFQTTGATTGTIVNSATGSIIGRGFGIRNVSRGSLRVTNFGTITATNEAVHSEGAGTAVQNMGDVSAALGIYINVEGGSGSVVNSGRITGDQTAIYKEGGGTFTVRNSGTIDGSVSFLDGANTFNGKGGTVTGTVSGGTGADRLIAGNDGETLAGGAGHDTMVGGTGEDTFAFASFQPADADIIHMFNVTEDTIQLDHSAFTRLAADKTPVFAIGTAATSAADHLFYNTTTGALSYDVDGSATAGVPRVIATLDTGLKLTAHNFTVV